MIKCPNCDKDADFTVKVDEGEKTARVELVHVDGHDGVWLRDNLVSKSYKSKLLRALILECQRVGR